MIFKVKNDSKRLLDELLELKTENKPLSDLLLDLQKYVAKEFEKDVIITMIFRTQDEQYNIYGRGYNRKSPHQFWQGVDIRSWLFDASEIKQIEDYLNDKYNDANYYSWTAKDHDVGLGTHFHIQYLEE